jgi:hypothetical protein
MNDNEKQIDLLINILNEYLKIVGAFSKSENELAEKAKKLNLVQKVSMDFFLRTNINIDAIIPLLSLYKNRKDIIQPIALILRSVFSDLLTQCYLDIFSGDKNETTDSFKNELFLLDREFLRSFLEVGEMELKIKEYLPALSNSKLLDRKELAEMHDKTKKQFNHLFKINGDFKSTSQLRTTSDDQYFKSKKDREEPSGFMTEKYKWRHIEREEKFKQYVLAFFGFKLFSQFQHYSSLTMVLLEKGYDRLYYYMIVGIDTVFISTDLQIQIIGGHDNKFLTPLRKLKDELAGCF